VWMPLTLVSDERKRALTKIVFISGILHELRFRRNRILRASAFQKSFRTSLGTVTKKFRERLETIDFI